MDSSRSPTPSDDSQSSCGLTFALQALLSRHESYVAESQEEDARLNSKIAQLEADRTSLQTANEKIVAENRQLLEQLDSLNASYKTSDETVKSLEALLRDTELEVRRLNGLARRAEELEARVQDLDLERSTLRRKLDDGEIESRSTLMRWRESERKVKQLEIEVEKIEWEARLEREKHEEVVARLERERVLERELGGAEGRLKGAAALQGIGNGTNNNVVSSFVRDILQDNASLQAGIVELRELLQSSNDEVQNLRQQVIHHQPLTEEQPEDDISKSLPPDQQLGWNEPLPNQSQREVHVHHHYHAKLAPKRDRTPTIRRTSRRRPVMHSITPDSSVPSTPLSRPQRYISSPVAPLHLPQPQPRTNRWSNQSAATFSSTISSLPSSPRSGFDRYNSIFEGIDVDEESSRPTSPESAAGFTSPDVELNAGPSLKSGRLDSFDAVLEDDGEVFDSPKIEDKENEPPLQKMPTAEVVTPARDLTPKPLQILSPTKPMAIAPMKPKPPNAATAFKKNNVPTPTTNQHPQKTLDYKEEPDFRTQIPEIRPSLRRSESHDSLVSISGMDIHLAKRPSASLRVRGNPAHFAISPSSTRNIAASQPVAGITGITATSSQRSFSSDNHGPAGRSLQSIAGVTPTKHPDQQTGGLGRLGGWVRGKWGVAPMKSVADLRSSSLSGAPAPAAPVAIPAKRRSLRPSMSSSMMSRTPGINQKGGIPGFLNPQKAPSEVTTTVIDEEGLKEVLEE